MLFENGIKHPKVLSGIAMICLGIAFALRYNVQPTAGFALYVMEGFQGLLIGMALVFSLRAATVRATLAPDAKATLLHRGQIPAAIIAIGMFLLAIAVASLKFLRPSARFGPDLVDQLHGVLFGISIGMNLLGVAIAALRLRVCLPSKRST